MFAENDFRTPAAHTLRGKGFIGLPVGQQAATTWMPDSWRKTPAPVIGFAIGNGLPDARATSVERSLNRRVWMPQDLFSVSRKAMTTSSSGAFPAAFA